MVSIEDYKGREQAYVKHVLLEQYLQALVHKTASVYPHIVYVDGFAGPWQSANENHEDTSFGIALRALRTAKAAWKGKYVVRLTTVNQLAAQLRKDNVLDFPDWEPRKRVPQPNYRCCRKENGTR